MSQRNVPATESDLGVLRGLEAVVQYQGKTPDISPWPWRTMAAFDSLSVAEGYAERCGSSSHWEYRAIPIVFNSNS